MAMWSATTDVFPVSLYYKSTPVLGGILKPSKAPAKHHSWSICVYLDETNQNLELFSTSNETISYYLYNEDGEDVSNGIISFIENDYSSIYLGILTEGVYTIDIICNGITYEGSFQL